MNNLRNSSNLRSTKAAIAGATIAVIALAGSYFYKEIQEDKVIAYVTRPSDAIQIEDGYCENLSKDNFTIEESKKLSR